MDPYEKERIPVEWSEIDIFEISGSPWLRWINCPYYEICLNKTAREDWTGWTCLFCPFQEKYRKEPT